MPFRVESPVPSHLEKRLLKQVGRASAEWGMIGPGDRVMACLSGGKDSYAMTWLLRLLQRKAPFDFDLIVVNLDQGHPGFPGHVLEQWLTGHGFEHRLIRRDTHSIVTSRIPAGKTFCSLCSRLRRGILYETAVELGATRIALGHHRDDINETLLLNLFYSGQLGTMPPILRSDDGRNTVIRPLAFCREADIARYAEQMAFPIVPCDLCGTQESLRRGRVKRLIAELAAEHEDVPGNLFAAAQNVRPTHLLDRDLRARLGVEVERGGEARAALDAIG